MQTQQEEFQARELALVKKELEQIKRSNAYIITKRVEAYYTRYPILQLLWRAALKLARLLKRLSNFLLRRSEQQLSNSLRRSFESSLLFDENFYAQKYASEIKDPADLISDYLDSYPAELRDPCALFSSRFYLTQHPDVQRAGVHPFVHFLLNGQNEGRAALAPHRISEFLEDIDSSSLPLPELIPEGQKLKLHCYEKGNFFFSDIATYLENYLTHLGYEIETDIQPAIDIVIAPHEFMIYGEGKQWSDDRIENSIYLNTEQWQTSWFTLSLRYMQKSKLGCLDINPTSAAGLAQLGIRAAFLPILPLPGSCFEQIRQPATASLTARRYVRALEYPEDFEKRIYDIMLIAVSNPRREHIIAGLAPVLSKFSAFIHCPKFSGPIEPNDPDAISSRDLTQLAKNSKILLNIHRDEMPYFEWHRVFLYGVMNGCVVVTEPCYQNPYLVAGEHYIEATADTLPTVLSRLLSTPDGQSELVRVHATSTALAQDIQTRDYTWE